MAILRSQITGIVLAGGRGSRMGGADKGLQLHDGQPLVWHALQRLAPQVGSLLVSANRNAAAYAAFGWPVLADAQAGHPGPLAGMLAGLDACPTPYLATVPCDAPRFPSDLVPRLAHALQVHAAAIAMAATPGSGCDRRGGCDKHEGRDGPGALQPQPVFCLMASTLRGSLVAALRDGRRSVEQWAAAQGCVQLVFDDASAFASANTPLELAALRGR